MWSYRKRVGEGDKKGGRERRGQYGEEEKWVKREYGDTEEKEGENSNTKEKQSSMKQATQKKKIKKGRNNKRVSCPAPTLSQYREIW